MNYWLVKTEPSTFCINDLMELPNQTDSWDGVRNYQARNFMRDDMKPHDLAFFYHSNCPEPGIVGIVEIVSEAYPDNTAFDPESSYFDPKSSKNNPRWYMVDVKFKAKFRKKVTLSELKTHPELYEMPLLQQGNRLSVIPITRDQWNLIMKLA